MKMVWPSGSELATAAAAMLVPAPGLFSITTCWPQIRDSRSAVMRATVSVDPPGAYGTTMRTGRAGQSCASAGRLTAVASANAAASGHAAAAPPTVAMILAYRYGLPCDPPVGVIPVQWRNDTTL